MSISHNEVEILFVDIVIATMLRCPVRKALGEMLLPGRGSQRKEKITREREKTKQNKNIKWIKKN